MIGTNVNSFASFLHFSPFNFNFSSFTNASSYQYFFSISSSLAYVALLSNEILAKSSKQVSLIEVTITENGMSFLLPSKYIYLLTSIFTILFVSFPTYSFIIISPPDFFSFCPPIFHIPNTNNIF